MERAIATVDRLTRQIDSLDRDADVLIREEGVVDALLNRHTSAFERITMEQKVFDECDRLRRQIEDTQTLIRDIQSRVEPLISAIFHATLPVPELWLVSLKEQINNILTLREQNVQAEALLHNMELEHVAHMQECKDLHAEFKLKQSQLATLEVAKQFVPLEDAI